MQMLLTVEQAIRTKGLLRGKILAGHSGLQRKFTRIAVSETPDALDWLSGDELVCTTGYALIDNPKLQAVWIQGMAERNVAALVIKPERFLGKIPDHMLTLSDQCQFPLIELPLDVTWPAVIEGVMNSAFSIQAERMQASYDIYNQLTQLVLASRGTTHIIDAIARLAKNPVVLEDRFFNPISHSSRLNTLHRSCVQQRLQPCQRDEVKKHIKKVGRHLGASHMFPLKLSFGEISQIIAPIVAGKHLFGYLTVLLVDEESLDLPMAETIVKHGSVVLALELLNDNTRFEINSMEKTSLLRMLTGNAIPSISELKKKGGLLGIDFNLQTAIINIRCKPDVTYYSFQRLEKLILSLDPSAAVFLDKSSIVVFYHPQGAEAQRESMEETMGAARKIVAKLEEERYQCHAGIGNAYSQPDSMRRSYFEATQCMKKAAANDIRILCHDYRHLDAIVSLINEPKELALVADYTLRNLVEYDKENNTELVKTLHAYMTNKFNRAQAAKALNIHINTLSYRLVRIREILDVDLDDFEACTMLYIALRISSAGEMQQM